MDAHIVISSSRLPRLTDDVIKLIENAKDGQKVVIYRYLRDGLNGNFSG